MFSLCSKILICISQLELIALFRGPVSVLDFSCYVCSLRHAHFVYVRARVRQTRQQGSQIAKPASYTAINLYVN